MKITQNLSLTCSVIIQYSEFQEEMTHELTSNEEIAGMNVKNTILLRLQRTGSKVHKSRGCRHKRIEGLLYPVTL